MKSKILSSMLIMLIIIPACNLQPEPLDQGPSLLPTVTPVILPLQASLTPFLPSTLEPSPVPSSTLTFTALPTLTFSPSATSTFTPTNIPSPTFTAIPTLPSFDQVLTFGGGGGAFGSVGYCREFLMKNNLNVFTAVFGTALERGSEYSQRMGALCLWELNEATPFTIRLVSPDGRIILAGTITADTQRVYWAGHPVEESYSWVEDTQGGVNIELFIWWPTHLPMGQWQLSVDGGGQQIQGVFDATAVEMQGDPIARIHQVAIVDNRSQVELIPVDESQRHWVKLKPGTGGLEATGTGFTPQSTVYVIVYQQVPGSKEQRLIYQKRVLADASQTFLTDLPGPFSVGETYLIIAYSNPQTQLTNGSGSFNFEEKDLAYEYFYIAP